MHIRPATDADAEAIWAILEPVLRAGDTYTLPPGIPRDDALSYWMASDKQTFVCEDDGRILGTYYLKANQDGGGAHVCNCGYMTALQARGRGVAGNMCEHSQDIAREAGFRAMQFNFVVSTNEGAIRLWKKLGYDVVGTLPDAFLHPREGYVDACIMYKTLV